MEITNGIFQAANNIYQNNKGSLLRTVIYTIGHFAIAITVLMLVADVSFMIALTDAIVEPLANSVWYFFLDKFWYILVQKTPVPRAVRMSESPSKGAMPFFIISGQFRSRSYWNGKVSPNSKVSIIQTGAGLAWNLGESLITLSAQSPFIFKTNMIDETNSVNSRTEVFSLMAIIVQL